MPIPEIRQILSAKLQTSQDDVFGHLWNTSKLRLYCLDLYSCQQNCLNLQLFLIVLRSLLYFRRTKKPTVFSNCPHTQTHKKQNNAQQPCISTAASLEPRRRSSSAMEILLPSIIGHTTNHHRKYHRPKDDTHEDRSLLFDRRQE